MNILRFLFCLGVLFPSYLHAARPTGMAAGLGLMPYNIFKASSSTEGGPGLAGEYYVPVHVRGYLQFAPDWYITPHALYTPLGGESADENYKTSILYFSIPVSYSFKPRKDVSFGIGYMAYTISPGGGTARVTHLSGTSEWGVPSGSKTVSSYYLELGLSETREKLNGSVDLIATKIFSKERSVTLLFTGNIHFLGGEK